MGIKTKNRQRSKFQLGGRNSKGCLPRSNKLAQYGMSNDGADSMKQYEQPKVAGDGLHADAMKSIASMDAVKNVTSSTEEAIKAKANKKGDPSVAQVGNETEPPEGFSTYKETSGNWKDKGIDWTKYGLPEGKAGYDAAVAARSKVKNSNPSDWRDVTFKDNFTWNDVQSDINTQMKPSGPTSPKETPPPSAKDSLEAQALNVLKENAETRYPKGWASSALDKSADLTPQAAVDYLAATGRNNMLSGNVTNKKLVTDVWNSKFNNFNFFSNQRIHFKLCETDFSWNSTSFIAAIPANIAAVFTLNGPLTFIRLLRIFSEQYPHPSLREAKPCNLENVLNIITFS